MLLALLACCLESSAFDCKLFLKLRSFLPSCYCVEKANDPQATSSMFSSWRVWHTCLSSLIPAPSRSTGTSLSLPSCYVFELVCLLRLCACLAVELMDCALGLLPQFLLATHRFRNIFVFSVAYLTICHLYRQYYFFGLYLLDITGCVSHCQLQIDRFFWLHSNLSLALYLSSFHLTSIYISIYRLDCFEADIQAVDAFGPETFISWLQSA